MTRFKRSNASERSVNITRHIGKSLIFKSGSIAANFLIVPLAINRIGPESYGIWLTISSILTWFMLFDIGLGNGLRNRFAEAKAHGRNEDAQAFVSTAYYSIAAISTGLISVFWAINDLIDWAAIFNATEESSNQLSMLVPVVFTFFSLQLVAKLIVSIYQADQQHSIVDIIQFFSQLISLLAVWFLLGDKDGSLLEFGILYTATPLLVMITLNVLAFNGRYERYKPKIQLFQKNILKDITQLGAKFFIIQIAATVLFSTDNLIVAHLYGPAEVVPYNVAFRYFSALTLAYTILVSPYWSAFTDAYANKDIEWIKRSVRRIQLVWLSIPAALIVMLIFADHAYAIWVGKDIAVPLLMNLSMALYILLITFNTIYVQFINGIGKIWLQLMVSIAVMFINIPLSIFMADTVGLGSSGVILASSMCLGVPALLWYIQYTKIINGTAQGIWNK